MVFLVDTSSDDSFFGWFQKEIDSDMDDLGDVCY